MAISSNNNDNDAILSEGLEIKNIQPDTKAKDLKRIADSLEKLVELQTPKKLSRNHVTIAADGYDVANKIAERIKYEAGKTFDKGGKLDDEVPVLENREEPAPKVVLTSAQWRSKKLNITPTVELQRMKNYYVVLIAEIEAELGKRNEKPAEDGWVDVSDKTAGELLEVVKEEVKEVQAKKTVPEAEYKKLERKVKSLEQEVEDLKEVNRLLVEFQHRYNEDHN